MTNSEKRKNNIVCFNISEPSSQLKTENKEQDRKYINKFFSEALQIDIPGKIEDTIRLGKKSDYYEKPRPLLVKLVDNDSKSQIFKKLKSKKHIEECEKVVIKNDLTKKEQEEEKKLYEEAKRRTTSSSDFLYKVRGLPGMRKIVEIPIQH